MWYLINETDLKDLTNGKTSIEKLIIPDNLCLVTFTGEDIKQSIEKKGIKLNEEEFKDLIYKISHDLEHCECWACIESALDSEIESYTKDKQERRGI